MENPLIVLSDRLINVNHLAYVEKVKLNSDEYPYGIKFVMSLGMGDTFYEKFVDKSERDSKFNAISIHFGVHI
jgi:hypothetical protein